MYETARDTASDVPQGGSHDVIVIGGGVAGLLSALRCARAGLDTLLLEAESAVGGCVRSHEVAGLTLDRGAESFATARPAVTMLAAEIGLAVEAPAGRPAWLYHRGGPAPIPSATLLGIPARPTAADVRRVIGWPGALRAQLDRVLPVPGNADGGDGADDSGTGLGELVARRLGRRVLRRLVAPIVAGVYSADPAGLDTAAVAPGLLPALRETGSLAGAVARLRGDGPPAGSAVKGVTGGMARLTDALLAALIDAGGAVRTSAPVRGLVRGNGGWTITIGPAPDTTSPAISTLKAASAVIAVPGAEAVRLLAQATDGAIELPTAPATEVAIVTLVVDEPALDAAPRGTGLLVAPDVTAVAAKALTHATAKWDYLARAAGPHRHVLRLSYGRGGSAEAAGARGIPDMDAFPDLALRDASLLLGVPLDRRTLADHAVVRYSNQLAARRADQRAALERIPLQLKDFPGLAICGSAIAGTGLGAVVANATDTPLVGTAPLGAGSKHDHD